MQMRKLLVPFLLLLLLPATAFAREPTPPPASNGTLSIREGRGIVQLNARGSVTGRVRGRITITDPNPIRLEAAGRVRRNADDLQEREDHRVRRAATSASA